MIRMSEPLPLLEALSPPASSVRVYLYSTNTPFRSAMPITAWVPELNSKKIH
jgi:hypothetical protein